MLRKLVPVVLILTATATGAQVYKWKDANGTTHYSDAPPAGSTHYERVQISTNTATPVANAPAPAASPAASVGTAAQPAAPAATKVADTPANRATLCKQLASNIALMGSNQTLTVDNGGKQEALSDDARRQQLATARAQQSQYCANH